MTEPRRIQSPDCLPFEPHLSVGGSMDESLPRGLDIPADAVLVIDAEMDFTLVCRREHAADLIALLEWAAEHYPYTYADHAGEP